MASRHTLNAKSCTLMLYLLASGAPKAHYLPTWPQLEAQSLQRAMATTERFALEPSITFLVRVTCTACRGTLRDADT